MTDDNQGADSPPLDDKEAGAKPLNAREEDARKFALAFKVWLKRNPRERENVFNAIIAAHRSLRGLSTNPRDWILPPDTSPDLTPEEIAEYRGLKLYGEQNSEEERNKWLASLTCQGQGDNAPEEEREVSEQ